MSFINKNKNNNIDLNENYLSFIEIISQSIGSIAPTASFAFVIPLVYATAGNGTWLVYLFALLAVLLVAFNLNKFTERSASPGSLYTYIVLGLGPTAGFIAGWALLLGYGLTASAVLSGFMNFGNELLGYLSIKVPLIIIGLAGALLAWYISYTDIKLSAKLTLLCEGISVGIILILGIIVLINNNFKIDFNQLKLTGVSLNSIRTGLVIAFFSFVGFESATSLGGEAKEPLKTIPKTLITSTIIVGVLFVTFSYIEILGFLGSGQELNESAAPLTALADINGVGFFGVLLSIGTLFSFWASFLACINAGARILLIIARHNIFNKSIGTVHEKNKTPYVAITILSIISSSIVLILVALGFEISDIYGWIGTLATFGLIFNYLLISIAAPVYLKKKNQLRKRNIILSVLTSIVLLIPLVGSVYPIQEFPYNLFPIIFVAWLLTGALWFEFRKNTKPNVVNIINKDIIRINEKFEGAVE